VAASAPPGNSTTLTDATRARARPGYRREERGIRWKADATSGRINQSMLANRFSLIHHANTTGVGAQAMVAPLSRSTAAGGQDDVPINSRSTDAQALLGPAPLVLGEDKDAYAALLARVQASVEPKDILEEFWVKDVVDLTWETVRLRRMKANIITATAHGALERILAPILNKESLDDVSSLLEGTPARKLAAGWYKREKEAVNKVEAILKSADHSMEIVTATALRMSLDDIERIDRMIMNAEARRNAVLREVARHRAAFADELRRSSQTVRDAEFTEVGPS
jgi:hypothetical protein